MGETDKINVYPIFTNFFVFSTTYLEPNEIYQFRGFVEISAKFHNWLVNPFGYQGNVSCPSRTFRTITNIDMFPFSPNFTTSTYNFTTIGRKFYVVIWSHPSEFWAAIPILGKLGMKILNAVDVGTLGATIYMKDPVSWHLFLTWQMSRLQVIYDMSKSLTCDRSVI